MAVPVIVVRILCGTERGGWWMNIHDQRAIKPRRMGCGQQPEGLLELSSPSASQRADFLIEAPQTINLQEENIFDDLRVDRRGSLL